MDASGSLGDIGLTAVVVLVVADMGQVVTTPAAFKGVAESSGDMVHETLLCWGYGG